MASNRKRYRMSLPARGRQGGMTVIGFLFLAALIGLVGLAGIKVFPLYYQNMRLGTVMSDMQRDLSGTGATPQAIRVELDKRFAVEGVRVPSDSVSIMQSSNGYQLNITHEARAPYVGNIWFLVEFDKQVEIRR